MLTIAIAVKNDKLTISNLYAKQWYDVFEWQMTDLSAFFTLREKSVCHDTHQDSGGTIFMINIC